VDILIAALATLISGSLPAMAQDGTWKELPNSPFTSRHNDARFVSENVGWIVNGAGEVYRTNDGGDSWTMMFSRSAAHFRSVGFFDEQLGFIGNVGVGEFGATDPVVLRRTRDGGQSWSAITQFDGPPPVGLCGMRIVNDSMIVAVGRVRGPAYFIKSVDRGISWTSVNLDSLAAGLIDVHFFNPDSGFVVGLTNENHDLSNGVILFTADGGRSWEERYRTVRSGEWFWKLSFPSRNVGYVSLQRNSRTPIYFVKTTDGGRTWEDKLFSQSYYFVQGLGFIDDLTGWIGGNSSQPTFETSDGGETWRSAGFGVRVNRFRFLGDSLGYAVGRKVYKFQRQTNVAADVDEIPDESVFLSAFPNPFRSDVVVEYHLRNASTVALHVSDLIGRRVHSLESGSQRPAGRHSARWDGRDDLGKLVAGGIYIVSLETGGRRYSKTLTIIR
jgi:photosystem II stability/assembly factor-like uncharacterized protein